MQISNFQFSHNIFVRFDQGSLYKTIWLSILKIEFRGPNMTTSYCCVRWWVWGDSTNRITLCVPFCPICYIKTDMSHAYVHHIIPKQAYSFSCKWPLCVCHKIRSSNFQRSLFLSSYRQSKVQILYCLPLNT